MTDCSTASVVRTRFPTWRRSPEGALSRTWHLEMEESFAERVGHEYDLSVSKQPSDRIEQDGRANC